MQNYTGTQRCALQNFHYLLYDFWMQHIITIKSNQKINY